MLLLLLCLTTEKTRSTNVLAAVVFLESMGLPKPMLNATRKQVEQGKLDWTTSEEYKLYARHNKPVEE